MAKKQTRVNRGARTGGHEQRTEAATKEQAPVVRDTQRPIIEQVSHKKERKFGHN
ncbi:hypothetical protein ACFYV5_05045 [Streptomyces sp. NPDC003035]|uniref:hypothetical protein n=1 Tax=unclassified Streptomyces TaxID=2593676 RepID=UPI0033A8E0F8